MGFIICLYCYRRRAIVYGDPISEDPTESEKIDNPTNIFEQGASEEKNFSPKFRKRKMISYDQR